MTSKGTPRTDLFSDEAHTIIGAGARSAVFGRGNIQGFARARRPRIIAAPIRYKEYIGEDDALARVSAVKITSRHSPRRARFTGPRPRPNEIIRSRSLRRIKWLAMAPEVNQNRTFPKARLDRYGFRSSEIKSRKLGCEAGQLIESSRRNHIPRNDLAR